MRPLPLNVTERIDEICDRFEAAWKAGGQPRVEDFLTTEVGAGQDVLLRELRNVDDHYRRRMDTSASAGSGPRVAGYEVLGEIGRGGMGVVYKARQLRPNRLVALKMISAGANAGPRERERFKREADAVAHLQHPHIVQVYEVGEQDGCPYFALEYVAGGSLDRFLAGTPQPPRAAAELVEHLAHAIHHAHQRGIIHRDLKPANVLLSSARDAKHDGQETPAGPLSVHHPKITDFGLAKLLDADTGTRSGDLLGTPSYMAPEQARGSSAPISAATDTYGLGAILYEMITGRPPFRGETALETMLLVQAVEPVSPSRLQPKCPRDLVTICLKCLHKQPQQRYASAQDLADDLRRFREGLAIRARPVGPIQQAWKWTTRQPAIATLLGALLLAILLGLATGSWFWWRAEEGLGKTQQALLQERAERINRLETLDRYQVMLAHREWLANNAKQTAALLDECSPQKQQSWEWRYVNRLRHAAARTFAGHENVVRALAIDPLSRQVASAGHDQTVRLWDMATGEGKILGWHLHSLVVAVAYSPDGKFIASSDSHHGRIRVRNLENGVVREVRFGEANREIEVSCLAFHPNSRYLAAGGPGWLRVWDVVDHQLAHEWPAAHQLQIAQVAFSPDGRWLVSATRGIKVWNWETRDKEALFTAPGHELGTTDVAFSPTSDLLASCGRDGLIRFHGIASQREEFAINTQHLAVNSICFSPDGERIASAGQEGDMHVWQVQQRRRLFTLHGHTGAVWCLRYSPDGRHLVSSGADFQVRAWDAASSQEAMALPFRMRADVSALAYGPGGKLIAWGDIHGRIGIGNVATGKPALQVDPPRGERTGRVAGFTFNPSGQRVAWRHWDAVPRLWDLGKRTEIPLVGARSDVLGISFAAAGQELLAAHWEAGHLHVRNLLTGVDVLRIPRPQQNITQVVWSPLGDVLVTLEDRRWARLWDTAGRMVAEFEHQPAVRRLAFSENGKFLAMGGVGGKLSVWDLTTNRERMSVVGHANSVQGLALSPDGQRVVSTSADCTARIWDTRTHHEVLTLRTQLHEVSLLAFSPDGDNLVAIGADNRLQVLSVNHPAVAQDDAAPDK